MFLSQWYWNLQIYFQVSDAMSKTGFENNKLFTMLVPAIQQYKLKVIVIDFTSHLSWQPNIWDFSHFWNLFTEKKRRKEWKGHLKKLIKAKMRKWFNAKMSNLKKSNFYTVKPLITNTSKEFIKCRILHFLIMECCRYLVF